MKNLPLSLTVSVVSGALTLIRPADWSARTRRAYVYGPGALAGAVTAAAIFQGLRNREMAESALPSAGKSTFCHFGGVRTGDDGAEAGADPRIRPVVAGAVLAIGAGMAVSGAQAASLRLDAAMERWLAHRGVARPRRWMAAAVALLSMGVDVINDRGDARSAAGRS